MLAYLYCDCSKLEYVRMGVCLQESLVLWEGGWPEGIGLNLSWVTGLVGGTLPHSDVRSPAG